MFNPISDQSILYNIRWFNNKNFALKRDESLLKIWPRLWILFQNVLWKICRLLYRTITTKIYFYNNHSLMIKETSTWKNKIKKNKHYRSKTEVILISYFLIWKLRVAIYLQWNQSSRSQEFQKSKTFWGQRIEQCLARRNLNENLLCGTYLEGCPVDRILYPSTILF